MADQQADPISVKNQSINWLVGLSGAALGGALLKFDWLLKLSLSAKISFLIAAIFFLASILVGVFYAFQMLAVGQVKDDLAQAKAEWPPNDDRINAVQEELRQVRSKARNYHLATMATFGLAGIATVFLLGFALLMPPAEAKAMVPLPNKFTLFSSVACRKGRPPRGHTFLLNQQTGEIWVLVCVRGKSVQFRCIRTAAPDCTTETK